MFDDENPWSDWLSNDGFAHPSAPVHGGGFRRRPGLHKHTFGAVDPYSPVGLGTTPDEAASGYALFELERTFDGLRDASSPGRLRWVIMDAFGLDSFSGRFSDALQNGEHGRRLLRLQKLMLASELHDYLTGRLHWRRERLYWCDTRPPKLHDVGQYLCRSRIDTHCDLARLKRTAEERDALLKELGDLFTKSEKVIVEARAKLDPRTREYWQQYNELAKTSYSRSDAGWALGKAYENVFIALAAFIKNGDFQARITSASPLLTKYALMRELPTGPALSKAGNTARQASTPTKTSTIAGTSSSTNPAQSVSTPLKEERILAAQENAEPDDGLNGARFKAREKIVRDFYEGRPGLGQLRADQDMGCNPVTREPNKHSAGYGIDLSYPVKVVDIPPPPIVEQYVKPHGNPGNFFDPIGGQSADKLGLNGDPKLRRSKSFTVRETSPKQQALISRNGPVIDYWTDESKPVATKGTGTQMTVDNITKASLTPQPQTW